METRINLFHIQPEAYKALSAVESYVQTINLSPIEKELIKIRASQINGCAFCINMHTKDARKYGETEQRIYLLNAWKEVGLFTERERTLLAFTEEITLISQAGLSDDTYNKGLTLFTKIEIAQIIMAIVAINAWNRVAVSSRLQPAD